MSEYQTAKGRKVAEGLEKGAGKAAMQIEPGYETCYATLGHKMLKGKSANAD